MFKPPLSPGRRGSSGGADVRLPEGECRYILLLPEIKGQRCGCAGFSLNDSIPGSSCDCGHQACYHISHTADTASAREDIEFLKQKVQMLEEQLSKDKLERIGSLAMKVSEVEEHVEKFKFETDADIKGVYKRMEGLWQSVGSLQNALLKHRRQYDDRIDALVDASHSSKDDLRLIKAQLRTLDEMSMTLEDRLDLLEENITDTEEVDLSTARGYPPSFVVPRSSDRAARRLELGRLESWTVHVSLMPTADQPFPFEKDTVAYKRCLSRGLHRTLAIPGTDSLAFNNEISRAFLNLLRGRKWMPLVAKICDAQNLKGLPMLRKLPKQDIDPERFDLDFLKTKCATLDEDGKIVALYIAMREDNLTWPEIHRAPPLVSGLEHCWAKDPILDGLDEEEAISDQEDSTPGRTVEKRSSAGDLLPAWSPTSPRVKRSGSIVQRGSGRVGAEGDEKRLKKARHQCVDTKVDTMRRRAEAV